MVLQALQHQYQQCSILHSSSPYALITMPANFASKQFLAGISSDL